MDGWIGGHRRHDIRKKGVWREEAGGCEGGECKVGGSRRGHMRERRKVGSRRDRRWWSESEGHQWWGGCSSCGRGGEGRLVICRALFPGTLGRLGRLARASATQERASRKLIPADAWT